ncbi:hypothetical protein VDG03_08510 [Xanthomonas campestris pv. raphani]|uniref:hypothetical protein n=1 Tax=Xanthomonas campestris TaxID=339 RepID=UPI002B222D16|nr:hypothetical protein [Xanthomonas campestris]MEA9751063.1 hypothetical protein [Xanthomonas campestris pv. raphani]MEA9811343.1 hypothetical protein [Xanthomonas campestris pv. raphani]
MSSEKHIRILSLGSVLADAQERYVRWFTVLQRLDIPWGMHGLERKLVKTSLSGNIGVSYKRSKGVKTLGVDFYQGRPDMDDRMGVTFNADKFSESLNYVWDVVIPTYIDAMQPYKLSVEDVDLLVHKGSLVQEMTYEKRMAYRGAIKSDREQLRDIWQVNFWADQQCRNYFGVSAETVVSRLLGHVAKAALLDGGAYIIYSYDVLSPEEVAAIEPAIRKLLN